MILWILTISSYSQIYPVQASVALRPPYTLFLADYLTPGSEKLNLHLMLRDLNELNYPVKLKLIIEGKGITIKTREGFIPQPIYLQGGVPEILNGQQLEQYFNPDNLEFLGFSKTEYLKHARLPEGIYQFCIEVYDYNRSVRVSNTSCSFAWMLLNDPPMINVPEENALLTPSDPQHIVFQWTPGHLGSPNASFTVEYQVALVELWPRDRNPNDAIRTTSPLFETTTMSTMLVYGPSEPLLVPGRKYAVRVRAVDREGRDFFKNNGFSEVLVFTYGSECKPVMDSEIASVTSGSSYIKWTAEDGHTGYRIRYREKDQGPDWYTSESFRAAVTFRDLEPSSTYEYQITSLCDFYASEASGVFTFDTKESSQVFNCEEIYPDINIENERLIQQLSPRDVIIAGDFDIVIRDIMKNPDGSYTGTGNVPVPYFNQARLNVEFHDIHVNENHKVIKGRITTQWNEDNLYTIYDREQPDTLQHSGGPGSQDPVYEEDTLSIPGVIDSVIFSGNDQVLVITQGGDSLIVDPNDGSVITDNSGNTYSIEDSFIAKNHTDSTSTDQSLEGGLPGGGGLQGIPEVSELELGALTFKVLDSLVSFDKDEEGYCHYKEIPVAFLLTLKSPGYELQLAIKDAKLTFEQKCDGNEFRNATVTFQLAEPSYGGDLGFVSLYHSNGSLTVTEEKVGGTVNFQADIRERQYLNRFIMVEDGAESRVTFNYNPEGDLFEGNFDFGEFDPVTLLFKQGDNPLVDLGEVHLGENGTFNSQLVSSDPVELNFNTLKGTLNFLDFSFSYQPGKFNIENGRLEFLLEPGRMLTGELNVVTEIRNNIISSSIETARMEGFGFTLENIGLGIELDSALDIEEISGHCSITHAGFGGELVVNHLEIRNQGLTQFSASGSITYQSIGLNIESTQIDRESDVFILEANAKVTYNGMNVLARVDSMSVDRNGEIYFGDYDVSLDGNLEFGPLVLSLTSEPVKQGRGEESGFRIYRAEASFYLEGSYDNIDSESPITKARISFEKHKRKNLYKNVRIDWDTSDPLKVGDLSGFQILLNQLTLGIDAVDEYLTPGEEKVTINGNLNFSGRLTEDLKITELVRIKKGAVASLNLSLKDNDRIAGNFKWEDIENLEIILGKDNIELASATSIDLDSLGNVHATIETLQPVGYQSNGFRLSMDRMNMEIRTSLHDLINEFKIISGGGLISVSEISGLDGTLNLSFDYGVDGNITARLDDEDWELKAFGMILKDPELEVLMDDAFDVRSIKGSVSASHVLFDNELLISDFLVENGALVTFDAEGKVTYTGFSIEVFKALMKNNSLQLDGKISVDVTGTSMWLAIKDFKISDEGVITISDIEGELYKKPVDIAFAAGFSEKRFMGSFRGNFASIGLEGNLDFGRKQAFQFAYLALTANTNIPLGNTGIKLTRIGGRLGYNYSLFFKENLGEPVGEPKEDTYVVGMTLGVADMADLCELTGTPIIQMGRDEIIVDLEGTIAIPRYSPVVNSKASINYQMGKNILSGEFNSNIMVPSGSGDIFKAEADIGLFVGNQQWQINSRSISGSIMGEVNFLGNVDFKGKISPDFTISGRLAGTASFDYSRSYSFEAFGAEIYSDFEAGFNFNGVIELEEDNIEGEVALLIYTNGELGIVYGVINTEIAFAGNCDALLRYRDGKGRIKGDMDVKLDLSVYEHEVSVSVDRTL